MMLEVVKIHDAVDVFYGLVEAAVSYHNPTVTLSRKYPPWFDGYVKAAPKKKENAFVTKGATRLQKRGAGFSVETECFQGFGSQKTQIDPIGRAERIYLKKTFQAAQ